MSDRTRSREDRASIDAAASVEIRPHEAAYPRRLDLLHDPPEILNVIGRLPDEPMVAIVGAREADAGMCRFASTLARGLAERGVVVISGGARGIDAAAHEGCLAGGGRTVAVLGSGFDHPYPDENLPLFARIAAAGALISEFPPRTPPDRWTFPRRNRIVAAMSRAVVVVQAAKRSGALITARLARGIGVPVGAVPGSPADPRSRGCNALIRGGAALIEDLVDILGLMDGAGRDGQLGLPSVESRGKESTPAGREGLDPEELMILERIGTVPTHIDDIVIQSGLVAARVATIILNLELAGFVEDRGGKRFVRSC